MARWEAERVAKIEVKLRILGQVRLSGLGPANLAEADSSVLIAVEEALLLLFLVLGSLLRALWL